MKPSGRRRCRRHRRRRRPARRLRPAGACARQAGPALRRGSAPLSPAGLPSSRRRPPPPPRQTPRTSRRPARSGPTGRPGPRPRLRGAAPRSRRRPEALLRSRVTGARQADWISWAGGQGQQVRRLTPVRLCAAGARAGSRTAGEEHGRGRRGRGRLGLHGEELGAQDPEQASVAGAERQQEEAHGRQHERGRAAPVARGQQQQRARARGAAAQHQRPPPGAVHQQQRQAHAHDLRPGRVTRPHGKRPPGGARRSAAPARSGRAGRAPWRQRWQTSTAWRRCWASPPASASAPRASTEFSQGAATERMAAAQSPPPAVQRQTNRNKLWRPQAGRARAGAARASGA